VACRNRLSSAIKTFLAEKQVKVIQAACLKYYERAEQLPFPDLVIAEIWTFLKRNVWQPGEEDMLAGDEPSDSDDSPIPPLMDDSDSDDDVPALG